jgi:hypothetical protein
MNDPIIDAAVDLKKELADVKSPELDAAMNEVMKILLDAAKPQSNDKKPTRKIAP